MTSLSWPTVAVVAAFVAPVYAAVSVPVVPETPGLASKYVVPGWLPKATEIPGEIVWDCEKVMLLLPFVTATVPARLWIGFVDASMIPTTRLSPFDHVESVTAAMDGSPLHPRKLEPSKGDAVPGQAPPGQPHVVAVAVLTRVHE